MRKAASRNIKNLLGYITIAVMTLTLAVLFAYPYAAAKTLADAEKRQLIEKMVSEFRANFPDVAEMEASSAMALMKDHKVVFIDVRRPDEQEVSMLPGAITHDAYLANPDKYKDYLKISYCTIGYRSGRFAQLMKNNGTAIYNLHGGMLGWLHDGGRVYDKNGQSFRIHVYGRPWKLAPEGYQEVW